MRKEIGPETDVLVYHSSTCSLKATVCFPLIVSGVELARLSARDFLYCGLGQLHPMGEKQDLVHWIKDLKKLLRKFSYNLEVYFVNKSSLIITSKLFCLTSKYFYASPKSHFWCTDKECACQKQPSLPLTTLVTLFKKPKTLQQVLWTMPKNIL